MGGGLGLGVGGRLGDVVGGREVWERGCVEWLGFLVLGTNRGSCSGMRSFSHGGSENVVFLSSLVYNVGVARMCPCVDGAMFLGRWMTGLRGMVEV